MAIAGPIDFFVNKRLDILRGVTYTGITAYVGLLTAGPNSSDGTGYVELIHADYARKACAFDAAAARQISNPSSITFIASATSNWFSGAAIKRFGIWDASTAGNLLWVDEILPVLIVTTGVAAIIGARALTLRSDSRTVAD